MIYDYNRLWTMLIGKIFHKTVNAQADVWRSKMHIKISPKVVL